MGLRNLFLGQVAEMCFVYASIDHKAETLGKEEKKMVNGKTLKITNIGGMRRRGLRWRI